MIHQSSPKPKVTKEKPSKPSPAKYPKRGKVQKLHKGKPSLQLINEDEPTQPEAEHQGEGDEYDVEYAIQMSLESFQAQSQAHVGGVAIRELVLEATRPVLIVEGKGKAIATEEQAAQSLLALHTPKRRSTTNQFIFQRRTPATEEASTGPSTQPQDDASANIVRESPSPADAETEEKTAEIDEGQAGSDPGKTPESRPSPDDDKMDEDQAGPDPGESRVALAGPNPEPTHDDFMANVYPNVHESLKFPADEHVILKDPLSSTGTLSLMKNLDDAFTIGDQFINDKSTEDESKKLNVEVEMVSMVTVPIYQASSSVPPLSTPVIDLSSPSKPVSSTTQAPIFTATTTTTSTTLPPPPQQQSTTESELAARVAALEHKFSVWSRRERILIIRLRVLDPGLITASSSAIIILKKSDIREAPLSSSKQNSGPDSEQPIEDVPMPDTTHLSDSEDTDSAHLPKIKPRPKWLKPILENDLPEPENNWVNSLTKSYKDPEENKLLQKTGDMGSFITWFCKRIGKKKLSKSDLEGPSFKDLEYLVSGDKGRRSALSISKLKVAQYLDFGLEELVLSLWIESEREYDISAAYVSLKTLERYGYTYLKEIVLRRADYKEYKISKADFKNLHPNDFEDLYLLHLQGQLNHLSRDDKVHLFNAVNLWIRNIVIRKRVEDLQLGIESYQTKLNLTQPDWDASDFLFKEDYTIVSKPRADSGQRNHMLKTSRAVRVQSGWKQEFGLRTIKGGVRNYYGGDRREDTRFGKNIQEFESIVVKD
ncbi:hypothetical protein Tco_0592578 [Tanacetum coccineum]